jgi:uncharacterized membrane-anchored protein
MSTASKLRRAARDGKIDGRTKLSRQIREMLERLKDEPKAAQLENLFQSLAVNMVVEDYIKAAIVNSDEIDLELVRELRNTQEISRRFRLEINGLTGKAEREEDWRGELA